MKALVYGGPGRKEWKQVPDPDIADDRDAIVRVDAVTICGTDLHILKGDVPETTPGRILGHEAVGTVVETGRNVENLRPGDHVLVSCISACAGCRFCREGRYGQCRARGGWVLGHLIELVDTNSTPTLLRLLAGHQIDSGRFITHRFGLDEFDEAYDVFARAGETGALKVVLSRS